MNKTEILSPAGDVKSLYAAFEAGADAVYFGVSEFNARKRAENILVSDLPEIVSEAALRGVKLYLTLNTIITSDEICAVLDLVDSAMSAGIRCFIIQDYGILNILDRFYPEAEIHLSTQATTHLTGQIDFFSGTSVSRINLARELSIDEICRYTAFAHEKGIETEVFVHGSYCLSYSGQCYLSSYLEGLSGNRGLCAQLCRRKYRKGGSKGYYLNLKDNSALSAAGELIRCGADSLKIEGRIKGSGYVYAVTRAWKEIVSDQLNSEKADPLPVLSSVFNRGFTGGYIENNISDMFSQSPSDASYRYIADVVCYSADSRILETASEIGNPEGIMEMESFPVVIKRNMGRNTEQYVCSGMILSKVSPCRYLFEIEGKLNGKIENSNMIYAREVLENKDYVFNKTDKPVFRKIPVTVGISCMEGHPLKLTLRYGEKSVSAFSESPLEKGVKRFSSEEDVEKQLMRFGNTPFTPEEVIFEDFEDDLFIPSSIVNRVRRKAVSMFLGTVEEGRKDSVLEYLDSLCISSPPDSRALGYEKGNIRTACIADNETVAGFLRNNSDCEILSDYRSYPEASGSGIVPIFPSIMTEDYAAGCIRIVGEGKFSRIVVNNTALIDAAEKSGTEWIAGNSLNIINHSAADFFASFGRFSGFIVSPEAGRKEIRSLHEKTPHRIYIPFYLRAELMTTRQCLLGLKCGRSRCDESCFSGCCGSDELTDIRGKKIIIEKSENSFTSLYDSRYHFIPDAATDFPESNFTYIIDLRIFPGQISFYGRDLDREIQRKIDIYKNVYSFLSKPSDRDGIAGLIRESSEGNYTRGLL